MANTAFADADQAKAVLRRNGRSFHFASHVLGSRHGTRAARLYALCRAIDDLADDAPDTALADARLAALSQALHAGNASDPIAALAFELRAETGLDLAVLLALIEGVRSDLKAVAIPDEAGLLTYAYAVAGTVGLMMCAVLDVKIRARHPLQSILAWPCSSPTSPAMSSEDARLGRRYLPASWIGPVDADALIRPNGPIADATRQAVQRLLTLADQYYESGEAGLCYLPPRARLAILIAARVYRDIGERLAAQDFQPWSRRAVVSSGRKLTLALQACLHYLLDRRLHRIHDRHEARLHAAIQGKPGTLGTEARA